MTAKGQVGRFIEIMLAAAAERPYRNADEDQEASSLRWGVMVQRRIEETPP